MEEVENLPIPEHEETFEELETSLLILCKSDDEQINDDSFNYNNPELSYTNDLNTKITNILNTFSNQNFSFPSYCEKVEQQCRLDILLYYNRLKKDPNYPLCSMVRNEDIAKYFSNCSKTNLEEVNPAKIKFPEQIDNRNKFIESEEESNSNEKNSISTVSDMSILSLSKKNREESFEEDSYDLMEDNSDEISIGCQSSTENDVGSRYCIPILSPTSDNLINSNEEGLYADGNNVYINESENSLADICENETKLHTDRINHPESEYIIINFYNEEELKSYNNKNNDILESENKIISNETSVKCQNSIKNDVKSSSVNLIVSPISDYSINSNEKLCIDENNISITRVENKIMNNCQTEEIKSYSNRNNDYVTEPQNKMMDGNENESKSFINKKYLIESAKIIDIYENEEIKLNLDRNNEYVSESENKIMDNDENEIKSYHDDDDNDNITELENKMMANDEIEMKSYRDDDDNDDISESENKIMANDKNEIKSYHDDDDISESENKIMANDENEIKSFHDDDDNDDISESENKIMANDENEIKLHHDDDDISELENEVMDNYESEVKLHLDKNKDDIFDSGNKNIENYENGEVKSHLDKNNEVIESENKILDDENEIKSHLVKNNDETKSKKEIKENYEKSEMLHINQTDLLNSTSVIDDDDDENDIDSMDLIILDSIDVDKEEEFNMKSEKINENDAFDGEKENVSLQFNIKKSNNEDESDYLIVSIDDTDAFSEQTESEVETKTNKTVNKTSSEQNISPKKQEVTKIPCKHPIRINRKWKKSDKILSEKSLPAKKIETKMEASSNLITSISAHKENIREKEIETKTEESSSNTKIKKPKYTIDDPLEIKDINDPEWENVKSLTTDEERYSAVKNCWGSKNVPNPHKDLTRHNFRLKRLKKEGIKLDIIKRKRTATTEPEKLRAPKRQKMESSCTEILDQRIDKEKKLYRQKVSENEYIYLNGLQKINNQIERERERLQAIYMQRFANSYQVGPLGYQHAYSANLELWRNYNEKIIRDREFVEKQSAKIRLDNENKIIGNTYQQTINKLYKAKEEVLKFNQFYCGLNNLNPVILDEKRTTETKKTEEMYEAFKHIYAA